MAHHLRANCGQGARGRADNAMAPAGDRRIETEPGRAAAAGCDAVPFSALLRDVPRGTLALICSGGAEPMGEVLARTRPSELLIASGPEGDFEPVEIESATRAGFVSAGLGPNRLRSETAAIAALAIAAEWLSRQSS